MILLNPGPVNVSARVTAALARGDLCHREPECEELLARIRARLLAAFAPAGGFAAVLLTGSGTAALEMAVTSVLSEHGRLVVVTNGVYGERIAAMAAAARLPYTVVESGLHPTHHNGAAQVLDHEGGTRFVWTTDVLPDAIAPTIADLMDRGIEAIKWTLETAKASC